MFEDTRASRMGKRHVSEQRYELEELEEGVCEGIGDMGFKAREIGLVIESARRLSKVY